MTHYGKYQEETAYNERENLRRIETPIKQSFQGPIVGFDSVNHPKQYLNHPVGKDKIMNKEKIDMVNNPPHYCQHSSGIEVIEITEHMNFCLGNAVKYILRAGIKDPSKDVEDLEKAIWYIKREVERLKK